MLGWRNDAEVNLTAFCEENGLRRTLFSTEYYPAPQHRPPRLPHARTAHSEMAQRRSILICCYGEPVGVLTRDLLIKKSSQRRLEALRGKGRAAQAHV